MKHIVPILFFLLSPDLGFAQKSADVKTLKGYFIVSCFDSIIRSGCGLDMKRSSDLIGPDARCGDGVFYKNLSVMWYVAPENIDPAQIDNFAYQVALQAREQFVYLSVDPEILSEAVDVPDAVLETVIRRNTLSAETLQRQIESLHPDFKKKRHYNVLMQVSIKVLPLAPREKTDGDPWDPDAYLLLFDPKNSFKAIQIIKDPF